MNTILELEKQILALSPAEREQLAMLAWDSLAADSRVAGDLDIDREGVGIAARRGAARRDAEIESGAVEPMDYAEFLRRTGGE